MKDLVESVLRFESYFLLMMLIMFGYLYEYSIQSGVEFMPKQTSYRRIYVKLLISQKFHHNCHILLPD